MTGARFVAWVGFVFGSLVSIGGNLLAARIPPKPLPPGWTPDAGAQVGSTVWPVALLISVEVLSRTIWPKTLLSRAVRYIGVGAVALFSAVISYQHIQAVLISWNYEGLSAGVGPLAVDGLMVVSGAAMVLGSATVAAHLDDLRDRRAPEAEAAPEPVRKSDPEPIVVRQSEEPRPEWGGVPFKNLDVANLPQPRQPVNGRKVSVAASKTRTSRAAAGPTVEEIVPQVVERMAAGEQITKRVITEEFGVGSGKANEALRKARELRETEEREEEQ
jgi:hypothetical protein